MLRAITVNNGHVRRFGDGNDEIFKNLPFHEILLYEH